MKFGLTIYTINKKFSQNLFYFAFKKSVSIIGKRGATNKRYPYYVAGKSYILLFWKLFNK